MIETSDSTDFQWPQLSRRRQCLAIIRLLRVHEIHVRYSATCSVCRCAGDAWSGTIGRGHGVTVISHFYRRAIVIATGGIRYRIVLGECMYAVQVRTIVVLRCTELGEDDTQIRSVAARRNSFANALRARRQEEQRVDYKGVGMANSGGRSAGRIAGENTRAARDPQADQ